VKSSPGSPPEACGGRGHGDPDHQALEILQGAYQDTLPRQAVTISDTTRFSPTSSVSSEKGNSWRPLPAQTWTITKLPAVGKCSLGGRVTSNHQLRNNHPPRPVLLSLIRERGISMENPALTSNRCVPRRNASKAVPGSQAS